MQSPGKPVLYATPKYVTKKISILSAALRLPPFPLGLHLFILDAPVHQCIPSGLPRTSVPSPSYPRTYLPPHFSSFMRHPVHISLLTSLNSLPLIASFLLS